MTKCWKTRSSKS